MNDPALAPSPAGPSRGSGDARRGSDLVGRLPELLRDIPVAHRVVIGVAGVVLVLAVAGFARWVSTPAYAILYTGLDDAGVASAIEELDQLGVPYQLEAGSRILVPRDRLYETRASLAAAGVGGGTAPAGYELLDEQGLSVSDFRQQVDYRRALEGELARTLMGMASVEQATVHLVLPERRLFTEEEEKVSASVLLDTRRTLTPDEVETVTFLVSSAVEGLEPASITVADVDGTVLAAPGEGAGGAAATSRNQRQTRAFEEALAADVQRLLVSATGDPRSSVVVRASLDFDERVTERERYDRDSSTPLKEQTIAERYEGTGAPPGGAVGVDGGPLPAEGGESEYQRDEAVTEFGVDREVERTVAAPGEVEKLSVAIVMDDGSLTGASVPGPMEVEELVTAALGLDAERGDSVAVSALPFPALEEVEEAPPAGFSTDRISEIVALVVLVAIALALFLMTRRRDDRAGVAVLGVEPLPADPSAPRPASAVTDGIAAPLGAPATPEELTVREQLTSSVSQLVERQPDEIALLLRSWLADRR